MKWAQCMIGEYDKLTLGLQQQLSANIDWSGQDENATGVNIKEC